MTTSNFPFNQVKSLRLPATTYFGDNPKLVLALSLTTLFDVVLLLYRNLHLTGYWLEVRQFDDLLADGRGTGFIFLIWNLFLAWVPYGISLLLRPGQWAVTTCLLLLLWLLFFPNAPYIITDLLHLRHRPPVPLWYDMLTIFAFAWTGLIFGYLSMLRVQRVMTQNWGGTWAKLLTTFALLLAGFGIYIGRFLRWNSWDLLTQPLDLLADLLSIFTQPALHWPAIGAGLLISILLLLSYATLKAIRL